MAPKITPASQASPAELQSLLSALRRTSLFQHVNPEDLFRVALDMDRVAFRPGDAIGPREGEAQDALFVVTTGRLVRRTGRGRRIHEGSEDIRPLSPEEVEEMTQPSGDENSVATPPAKSAAEIAAEPFIVVRATAANDNGGNGNSKATTSTIDIMCPDRPGLVGSVAHILSQQGLSIENSQIKTTKERRRKTIAAKEAKEEGSAAVTGRLETFFGRQVEETQTKDEDNFQHTAYQVHEVIDGKTFLPVSDTSRMRRIEAALRRDLEDYYYDNSESHNNDGTDGAGSRQEQEWKKTKRDAQGNVAATIVGSCRKMQAGGMNAFGTLHVFGELPAVATTVAVTSGVCWRLSSESLKRLIVAGNDKSLVPCDGINVSTKPNPASIVGRLWGGKRVPAIGRDDSGAPKRSSGEVDVESSFAVDIASGLAAEVFRLSNSYSTPLFEQPAQKVNVAAVSVASAVESYYRSALNSYLNAAIQSTMSNPKASGAVITPATMFPDMHIQIPARVLYINGFKLSRQWLAELVEEPVAAATAVGDETRQSLLMLIPALAPGVLMTPISSILEACNAGHSNPEPLFRRWMRGIVPRCGREIIFGLGLNNLTDWAEERIPRDVCEGKVMRNALGSLAAGVISGYFSHVPHNLSTMKLLQPDVSYRTHLSSLVEAAKVRFPANLPPSSKQAAATALALIWPKGLTIRTTQVVGSFVLLNGISHLLDQRR